LTESECHPADTLAYIMVSYRLSAQAVKYQIPSPEKAMGLATNWRQRRLWRQQRPGGANSI